MVVSAQKSIPKYLALVALLAGLGACGETVEPLGDGGLAVSWEVSPRGCALAGVETVEVRLENAHRAYDRSFACTDGQAVLEQLAPANYDLTVAGFDAEGHETFASKRELVTISAELTNDAPHLRLTAKPAIVEVGWRFSNGRVCGANGVSGVEVTLYDEAFYEIAHQRFSCDAGFGEIDELIAGEYIVEAVARADESTYRGIAAVKLRRGDYAQVDVELEPENTH